MYMYCQSVSQSVSHARSTSKLWYVRTLHTPYVPKTFIILADYFLCGDYFTSHAGMGGGRNQNKRWRNRPTAGPCSPVKPKLTNSQEGFIPLKIKRLTYIEIIIIIIFFFVFALFDELYTLFTFCIICTIQYVCTLHYIT